MNKKQIAGLIVLLAGITLLCFGFYGTSRMAQARQDIDTATGFIPKNPVKGAVTGALHSEVDKYKTPVTLCYIGGIVLIGAGASLLIFCRKRK